MTIHALATLGQWLTLAVAAGIFLFIYRNGGGAALNEMKAANGILTARVHTLSAENIELRREIAELRGRTDVAAVISPLTIALQQHDSKMDKLGEGILSILDTIARNMGPEE